MSLSKWIETAGLPDEAGDLAGDFLQKEALSPEEAGRILARTLQKAGLPPAGKGERPRMKKIRFAAALLAASLCVGSMAVCAAAYFKMDGRIAGELGISSSGAQAGFEESVSEIGSTADCDGWALTVRQAVGDRNCAYLLLDLDAPQGTVLDADSYFLHCGLFLEGAPGGGWGTKLLEDEDPADGHLSFLIDLSFDTDMRSGEGVLRADGLEAITWSPDHQSDRVEPVTDASWELPFRLEYQDETAVLRLDQAVSTRLGDLRVETAELSPLSVSLTLSGEGARYDAIEAVAPGALANPDRVQLELLNTRGEHLPLGMFRTVERENGLYCVMTLVPTVEPGEIAALVVDGVTVPLQAG